MCRMEMVSMKSGKAPRNLPTRSRAELSPSSFCVGREGALLGKKDEQFLFMSTSVGKRKYDSNEVEVNLSVAIKDDLLEVLKIGIVDEGAEVGPGWRGDCKQR